jgi:hypothetical protein
MKTLIGAENLCKKGFTLKGGEASSWFHIPDGGYYDVYKFTSYQLKIGFYQHVCVNGKKVNSSEYGVDFNVIANPRLIHHFPFASDPSTDEFYVNRGQTGLPLHSSFPLPEYAGLHGQTDQQRQRIFR